MREVKRPFFMFNPKSYCYGDQLVELAVYADKVGQELGIDVCVTCPYADISRVAAAVDKAVVCAQGMDGITPGRGMGAVLPESLKAAGCECVVLNHAERPMTTNGLVKARYRAKELDMMTIICADTAEESRMIATLEPECMICEPTALIGTGTTADASYIKETVAAVKAVSPNTAVLIGSGISTGEDVYKAIKAGGDASGATSGITAAPDPKKVIRDMIEACAKAKAEGCI